MKCQNCQHTVTRKSKFCPKCGERILPRTSSQKAGRGRNISVGYTLGLVGLGILIGFAVFKYSSESLDQTNRTTPNLQVGSSVQSPAVLDIAKDFICPCGSCSDPLDTCQCDHPNGALEVKGFISQKLQEGHKKPHIVEMLMEKYAGLRSKPGTSF